MTTWPGGIAALTLFVEDLAACRTFYQEVFGQAAVFEDPHSAVFRFGETLVNLLQVDNAAELVEPATAASPEAGNRFVLTLEVDDVDAMCESLGARRCHPAQRADGPAVGPRTASFRDPGGHIWEIAH